MTPFMHVDRDRRSRWQTIDPLTLESSQRWDAVALDDAHTWLRPALRAGYVRPSVAYLVIKRALDIVVSAGVIALTAPVLLLLVLLIKLEHPAAPVLFSQQRTGLGGRTFRILKLRSMRPPTTDDLLRDLYAPPGAKDTVNPRITPLGRFIRRTSLDELPQLFNVLWGDMSLVGPRPTSLSAVAHDLWQTERLEVKPGLTGLWQIMARGAVSFPNRCRLDIAYARRPSLWFDLRILLRSIPAVLSGRGAR